jgi:hypothetical protein
MNIYTREAFYNDELAEVVVLTNIKTSEQKYLVSVEVPTQMGLMNAKIPIKATTLNEAFEKLDEAISDFEKQIMEKRNQSKLVVPPTAAQSQLIR